MSSTDLEKEKKHALKCKNVLKNFHDFTLKNKTTQVKNNQWRKKQQSKLPCLLASIKIGLKGLQMEQQCSEGE